jgi:hypothetical protein
MGPGATACVCRPKNLTKVSSISGGSSAAAAMAQQNAQEALALRSAKEEQPVKVKRITKQATNAFLIPAERKVVAPRPSVAPPDEASVQFRVILSTVNPQSLGPGDGLGPAAPACLPGPTE